ncbi:MAG: hypothetical protein U0575_08290 [Phycisphaerales bacterium]
MITIDRASYTEAFEAAVDTVRDAGMTTALRDREGGVIETEPLRAGTLIEPWRTDNSGISQASENTIDLRRRRVRFEFVSTGFAPPTVDPNERLLGPDLLAKRGSRDAGPLGGTGPIEVRAWVYLEQAHTPGMRRFTWTRRLTTRTINPQDPIDPAEGVLSTSVWTPIGRDDAYERRLLAEFQRRLGSQATAAPTPSAEVQEPTVPR